MKSVHRPTKRNDLVWKEKMTNVKNNIHFLDDAEDNFPIIVVMFPRKEELSRWLIKLQADPKI